jgi:hypothetical protein
VTANRHQMDLRESDTAQDDRSVGQLFGDLSREFSDLMREEVQLAKAELREEATKAGKAGGMFGGAAVAGYMTLLLVSFAAAWGLAELIPAGFAFLIVGVVYGVIAALLFVRGRKQIKQVNAMPNQTVQTLKEDARWAKAQLK